MLEDLSNNCPLNPRIDAIRLPKGQTLSERCRTVEDVSIYRRWGVAGSAYLLALGAASSDGLAGLAVLALLGETCAVC